MHIELFQQEAYFVFIIRMVVSVVCFYFSYMYVWRGGMPG